MACCLVITNDWSIVLQGKMTVHERKVPFHDKGLCSFTPNLGCSFADATTPRAVPEAGSTGANELRDGGQQAQRIDTTTPEQMPNPRRWDGKSWLTQSANKHFCRETPPEKGVHVELPCMILISWQVQFLA